MAVKKEVKIKISERNWERARQRAEEVGISMHSWIADKIEEKLNEEEALSQLRAHGIKSLSSDFPHIYEKLAAKLKAADLDVNQFKSVISKVKNTSDIYLHTEKLENASKNLLNQIKSIEPIISKIKNASRDSIRPDKWETKSKEFYEELKSLQPSIEKLKSTSRNYLHSEPLEKASKHFSQQMKAVESALKKLTANEKEKDNG
jgi:hypothetical protein